MQVNLAKTLARSAANGPGERFVVWVQGCSLACPGCWNRDMWSFRDRDVKAAQELSDEILATPGIEGVTFTGGEPFAQASALAVVARRVRRAGLSVFIFTGHTPNELTDGDSRRLLELTDVLVAGPYRESSRVVGTPWLGSANQEIHFLTARYSDRDFEAAPSVEIRIDEGGTLALTGFPEDELIF